MTRTHLLTSCSLLVLTSLGACGKLPDLNVDLPALGGSSGVNGGSTGGTTSQLNTGTSNNSTGNLGNTNNNNNSSSSSSSSGGYAPIIPYTPTGGSSGIHSGIQGSAGAEEAGADGLDLGAGGATDEIGTSPGGASATGSHAGGASAASSHSGGASAGGASANSDMGGAGTVASASNALVRGPAPTVESATSKGSYSVKTYTSGLPASADIGSQTLYYPADADAPFAGIVIAPGFISPESSIQAWGPFLASHGIVTLTIGTKVGTELTDTRAKALLEGVAVVRGENTRSGSPLQGKVAIDRLGIMGWSMGGGGTLIASNETPQLKAAVTLAAWDPNTKFSQDQVPTLLFAGSADDVAGGQSQGFYDSIPASTPKMLFEISGGGHSVANDPSAAQGEVGRYGLSWLKVFLEGDTRYRQFLTQTPTQQSAFKSDL